MAEGNPRISIRSKNGITPKGLDPVGLDIENGQFAMRKEVLLMPRVSDFLKKEAKSSGGEVIPVKTTNKGVDT